MTIDIHPIFVHFPVVLFTIYALFELIRIKKIMALPYWFYIKSTFSILGAISAPIASGTGELSQPLFDGKANIVEIHSFFAEAASGIFFLIAVAYTIAWAEKLNLAKYLTHPLLAKIWGLAIFYKKTLIETPLVIPVAFIGLILITIAGALGGSIVHGESDPVIQFVYKLLVH